MKRTAIRRKSRPRKQPDELERMAAFKAAADAQGCCQVCGGPADVAHHVVTQNHVRRENGDPWDPRLAIALCKADHDAHHSRQRPVPVSCVPTAALEFANELLGADAAYAYFGRYYSPRSRWIGYLAMNTSPSPIESPS